MWQGEYAMGRKIDTAGQAIDYLGGTAKVAALFGIDPRIISNWRFRGLPPDTYAVMAPALQARGVVFGPELFRQRMQKIVPPPYGDRRKRQPKAPSPTP